jgi:hypothetical protein
VVQSAEKLSRGGELEQRAQRTQRVRPRSLSHPSSGRAARWCKVIIRESLLHFLAIGLLLLVLAEYHKAQVNLYRIVVTPARVRQLTDGYRAEYGGAPNPRALATLIDADIDEEVLYREGIVRKLDRDDGIVRRGIVQKGAPSGVILALRPLAPNLPATWRELAQRVLPFVIDSFAAFWFLGRTAAAF